MDSRACIQSVRSGGIPGHQGFALVATVLSLVLLTLLLTALLSLSTVELRKSTQGNHLATARANARLALNLAIGEAQKVLGPDRRVTAPASILDDSIDPNKANWTTVWDTSNWDVTNPEDSRDSSSYLTTLVSGNQTTNGTSRSEATSNLSASIDPDDPAWTLLVGEGSVSESNDFVFAESVELVQGDSAGSYAYWVGDEGVKARFDTPLSEEAPMNRWAASGRMGLPSGSGIHLVEGMENYSELLPGEAKNDDLVKILDLPTAQLAGFEASEIRNRFHDLTTVHTGLLADNRWGGIRRDLSTAFEVESEDFGEIAEFNASGETNNTDAYRGLTPSDATKNPLYYSSRTDSQLGYLYEIPVDRQLRYRGPTWDLLRNHYRIYKKERNRLNFRGNSDPGDDAIVAHGVVPFSYNKGVGEQVNSSLGSWVAGPNISGGGAYQIPFVGPYGVGGQHDGRNGGKTEPTVQKITPQLIRAVFVYGLARREQEFFLTIDPFFVIHNPYNQPLEFHSLSFDLNKMNDVISFSAKYVEERTLTNRTVAFKVQEADSNGDLKALQCYRLKPLPRTMYRMEPGEIRVVSAESGRNDLEGQGKVIRLAEMQYNEGSGVFLGNSGKQMRVAQNYPITIEASLKQTGLNVSTIFTRLLHPLRADGGAFDIDNINTLNPQTNLNRNHDVEDITLIQQMRILAINESFTGRNARAVNYRQVPRPEDGAFYLYALDMGLKDFSGDVAVMSNFNHRCLGVDTRDYDGSDEIAPNWELDLRKSDLFDLQLSDAAGRAFWGESKTLSGGGSSEVVLFDLPRSPLVSLGALQHADTSKLNFHAMRSIANSRPQVGQTNFTRIFNRLSQVRTSTTPKYQFDTSWAANEVLWDRYFFSGISWGEQYDQAFSSHGEASRALLDQEPQAVLVNPRLTLMERLTEDHLDDLQDFSKIGGYLGISGAFNVNSTSVEAWKAVLASLSGREISYLSSGDLKDGTIDKDTAAFSRFTTPAGWDNDDYTGFRSLSEDELEDLAEAMVEQVKLRGPFMGLSDFVNRRLASDETGEAGAIQAAIDESGINRSTSIGSTRGNRLKQSAPDANEGMARHLSQGDILTTIGPILATRSDTFVIRTYGDSRDGAGNVLARAWCEAVIQRVPELLVPAEEEFTIPNPSYPRSNPTSEPILRQWIPNENLPQSTRRFGRKLQLVSFRWLSPDEV